MTKKAEMRSPVEEFIPVDLNPHTKKKFEAINSYDPYESVIADLNKAFHRSYNLAIHKTHQRLGREFTPVILMVGGEKVILFHNDKQETVEVIPDLYHRVKSISHISFGVYVTLAHNGYGPLRFDNHRELENIQVLIEEALSILDKEPIPANYFEVQRKTLANALAILDKVLYTGLVDKDLVLDFGRENIDLYLKNAALGTMLELDVLHETVMRWKDQLGPENWKELYVVICGGHQARYREASKQYFQRLLGDNDGEDAHTENRVVYAEHISDVDEALDLLARHINDQQASIELFNNPTRLQEDLMSDSAEAYLKKLLPD